MSIQMQTVPIFTSHYSLGSSILTFDKSPKPEDYTEHSSQSIIDLAIKNNIKEVFTVDNNMSGLITADKNCHDKDLKLRFGIKLVCCQDLSVKDNDSIATEHKVIIFAKNSNGYEKITDFYSKAATDGFYYRPRIDLQYLKDNWNKDVFMAIPFYYSFLHRNLLHSASCMVDFGRINPYFFRESNELPFDYLISSSLDTYLGEKGKIVDTKSIYYNKKKDFVNFITNKCIHERTYLNSPNVDHLGSDKFCLESWKEQNE